MPGTDWKRMLGKGSHLAFGVRPPAFKYVPGELIHISLSKTYIFLLINNIHVTKII